MTSRSAVQTIFVPVDSAFVDLLQSQGIRESELLAQPDKLRRLLQNHILPNLQVRRAQLLPGASFPTVNPNEVLTVAAPVNNAIIGADLQACNTILHELNVVLVPPGVLPLGQGTSSPSPTPIYTPVAVPVPVPNPVPVPVPAPVIQPSATTTLDITKVNVNANIGGAPRTTIPALSG